MSADILEMLKVKKQFMDIKKFLANLPKDGTTHLNDAKALEFLNWANSNISSDLLYKVHKYERKTKQLKDFMLVDKKSECEEKSDAAKERYAKSTEEYRKVANEYADAEALLEWFKNTKEDLKAGVYVMRSAGHAIKEDFKGMPDNGE